MTSRSLRKPRTTRARPTRRRTATSLLLALAAAVGAAGAAPAQVPDLPPVTLPAPQLPPPSALPAPAPRPQLVPADSRGVPGTMPFLANPSPPSAMPSALPPLAPAPVPTMTFTKPAGSEAARPLTASPVSRTISGQGYPARPQPAPAAYPVSAQPPTLPDKKPADKPFPDKSLEEKGGGPSGEAKDQGKLAPVITTDPNVPPIERSRAFRFDSDAELNKRIVGELVEFSRMIQKDREFKYNAGDFALPENAKVGVPGAPFVPKTAGYSPTVALIEPGYVVHRRLLFEEKNAERNGWDFGIIQPVVSTAAFYKDVLLMPAHVASNLAERYDTSAGKCLPGSPVPYYLYPEEITLFGATVGALTIAGTVYIFP